MNTELNLLTEISNIFTRTNDSEVLVNKIEDILKTFFKTCKLCIYIYDETTHSLRDFSKNWIVVDENLSTPESKDLYNAFNKFGTYEYFFNGNGFINYSDNLVMKENNTLLFPLIQSNNPYGILKINFDGCIDLSENFFKTLKIACTQISLVIQNKVLYEKMKKNIDFHYSMKSIAKIIETQFELNYIIPIIGEMIDKFIIEHLIYIFLKSEDESKFNLIWPLACRDKKILTALSRVDTEQKYFLIDNGKIGIFPLIGEGKLLGCIVAHSNIDKLNIKEIEYLDQLTKQASTTISRANIYAEVLKHATLDALTGINNRRQFEVRLKQEVATALRQNLPLCAIMLDIDFFKNVNDTYGHAVGDIVLKEVAKTIGKQLRESDIPCRYGGEEFAILLPFTKIEEAHRVAQRLRSAVEQQQIDVSKICDKDFVSVTISVGVSEFEKENSGEELYIKADKALYSAKTHGRNKVVIYNNEQ